MPEDRRLVPDFTVEENIRLPSWIAHDATTPSSGCDWIFSLMPEVAAFRAPHARSSSPAASRRWSRSPAR